MGAPGPTRTGDLPLRRRLLYPPELPGPGQYGALWGADLNPERHAKPTTAGFGSGCSSRDSGP